MSNIIQGHILKFIEKQRAPSHASRRLFPEQKVGQSKESPDWFKRKFSLQPQGGYEYKHDEPQVRNKFKYQSQKNQFFVNRHEAKESHQQNVENKTVNNLKKGLLSQYLDSNSWMKAVIPMTGFQRGEQSRRLNNRDRQKNIETAQFKKSAYIAARTASNFYSSKISHPSRNAQKRQIKTSHQQTNSELFENHNPENLIVVSGKTIQQNSQSRSKSIPFLMGQKEKIRSERLHIAMNKIHKIEKVKIDEPFLSRKMRTIDSQFVQDRMALTAREWGGKKISPFKSIERFDAMIGWNDGSEGHSGIYAKKGTIRMESENRMELFQENGCMSNQL